MKAAALRVFLLCALPFALAACTKTEQLTALVIVVDSDIQGLDSVRVDIEHFGKQPLTGANLGAGSAPLPRWLGLVHRGGPLGPITITAQGLLGGSAIVVKRQARVFFVRDKVMMLRLNLLQSCIDKYASCEVEGQTCTESGCHDAEIAATDLTEWKDEIPPLMIDMGADAGASGDDAATPDTGTLDGGEPPMCANHTANCDTHDDVDCETNLLTSADDCGACGHACPAVGEKNVAARACVSGKCQVTCDDVEHGDCDGDAKTGCETDLKSSTAHCGGCDTPCTVTHGSAACIAGSCKRDGCAAGWDDCDGNPLDCERDVRTPASGGLGPCLPDTDCVKKSYKDTHSVTHDYYFCPTARSWSDARTQCQKQYLGDLVRIDEAGENVFVKNNLGSDSWLGATDVDNEGAWRWSSNTLQLWSGGSAGSPVGGLYAHWNSGEPSNVGDETDCAQMKISGAITDGQWNALDCSTLAAFVCEVQKDECPDDPNKSSKLQCDCGTPDVHSDSDGVADCNDECPTDANKIEVGVCGCGVADVGDMDGDLTLDCVDGCPSDMQKQAVGMCGCGVPDTDTDSDGYANCIDLCPADPNKQEAGACGCGTADTDSDDDTVPDCHDTCPLDPAKTAPGTCGCGFVDTPGDSDSDGQPNCTDVCPNDPLKKTSTGYCGCGKPETPDSDSDGKPNCVDACNYDDLHWQLPCAYAFTPSNFDPVNPSPIFTGATDVTCSASATFDTSVSTAQTVCGVSITPVIRTQTGGPELWILPMNSLSVAAGVTLHFKGTRPVVLAVANDATISGTLDVSAEKTTPTTTPGAGGNVSCAVGTGQGGAGSYSSSTSKGDGGGGGGGFGIVGGSGGAGDNNSGSAGSAGTTAGNNTLVPLRGGCRGGAAPAGGNVNGAGAGGGAIQLSVGGKLTLGASAIVAAAGSGGLIGANFQDGGGGGGSGGGILIEANQLTVDNAAWITANGGGGAGGNRSTMGSGATAATNGANGFINMAARAAGGVGGNTNTNSSDGGKGGLGAAAALTATAGSGGTSAGLFGQSGGGGGGGGGGVGRIRIRGIATACGSVTPQASPTFACP